ncbi:MAG TPA: hypothetical protein VGC13_13420 [Longimicrobium sp.]
MGPDGVWRTYGGTSGAGMRRARGRRSTFLASRGGLAAGGRVV